MAEKDRRPEIRFTGFTDDWEQCELRDIALRVQGNDGRMDLATLTISAANGWLDQRDRFYGNIAGKEQNNYTLLKKGELSYNHGNSKLAKYGVVFELRSYEEALVPRIYHSFKMKSNSDANFIEYLFATKLPDKELGKLISSGARMDGLLNISFDEFISINIQVSSKDEQVKLGGYFRELDNVINLHQHKYEKLVNVKKSMLEKMFPKNGADVPEIRFKGFTDAWEQCKLGELAQITMGQSPNSENYTDNPNAHILVQGNADMKNGVVLPRVWTTQVTKQAEKNDLILSVRAPVGDVGKTDYDIVLGRGVAGIKGNEFIFQLLNRMKENGYWRNLSTGSTFESINSNDIKDAHVLIPHNNEQNKIGEFFKHLDTLIALHQRQLEKLKNIKKACLEKMFV